MHRFHFKLNRKILTFFLIGLLIGGMTIGIIDKNRPQPLFSSANDVPPQVPSECTAIVQQIYDFVNLRNEETRPVDTQVYQGWLDEWSTIFSGISNCYDGNCGPLEEDFEQSRQTMQTGFTTWSAAFDAADAAGQAADEAYEAWEEADANANAAEVAYNEFLDNMGDGEADQIRLSALYREWQRLLVLSNGLLETFNYLNSVSQDADDEEARTAAELQVFIAAFNAARQVFEQSHCQEFADWTPPTLDSNTASYRSTGGIGIEPADIKPEDIKNPKIRMNDTDAKVY